MTSKAGVSIFQLEKVFCVGHNGVDARVIHIAAQLLIRELGDRTIHDCDRLVYGVGLSFELVASTRAKHHRLVKLVKHDIRELSSSCGACCPIPTVTTSTPWSCQRTALAVQCSSGLSHRARCTATFEGITGPTPPWDVHSCQAKTLITNSSSSQRERTRFQITHNFAPTAPHCKTTLELDR